MQVPLDDNGESVQPRTSKVLFFRGYWNQYCPLTAKLTTCVMSLRASWRFSLFGGGWVGGIGYISVKDH